MASQPTRPIQASSRNLPQGLRRAQPTSSSDKAAPAKQELYVTIVVDHPKLYEHIRDKVFVVGNTEHLDIKCFVVFDDKNHPMAKGNWDIRQALVRSGIVSPEDMGMTLKLEAKPGLPDRSTE